MQYTNAHRRQRIRITCRTSSVENARVLQLDLIRVSALYVICLPERGTKCYVAECKLLVFTGAAVFLFRRQICYQFTYH